MKIKNLLAVAALCLFSSHASAQCRDYNGIYFQYHPTIVVNFDQSPYGFDNDLANAFSMGYVRSIPISSKIPFFLEVGGNLSYGFKSETKKNVTVTAHMMSFNIPVNFGYSFGLGSERLALNPYVGLRMRINALAQAVYSDNRDNVNFFLKEDLARFDLGSDYTWNIFQLGLQAGVKFIINKHFIVEAGYTYDLIPLAKCYTRAGTGIVEDYLYPMSINFGFGFCW